MSPIKSVCWTIAVVLSCIVLSPSAANADETVTFESATAALERGAFTEAIDAYELLADQGSFHPDTSFNRGLAYFRRAETSSARPGDFGNAAAAFAEALKTHPGDAEAKQALAEVRKQVRRERARQGGSAIVPEPRLAEALTRLLSEGTWAVLALLGSLATTVGLTLFFFRRRREGTDEDPWRLAGGVLGAVGALVLVTSATATAYAQYLREHEAPAVVVVPEARLLDDAGRPIRDAELTSLPETMAVSILETRGRLVRIAAGHTTGWLPRAQVRLLRMSTSHSPASRGK